MADQNNWLFWVDTIAKILGIFGFVFGLLNTKRLYDRPDLRGDVFFLVHGEMSPPPVIEGRNCPTLLVVYFWITNHKDKPVQLTQRYSLTLKIKNKRVKTFPYYIDPDKAVFSFQKESPANLNFKKNYLLSRADLSPIPYGGILKGCVSFAVPLERSEFVKDGTKILLEVEDVFFKKHKIEWKYGKEDSAPKYVPLMGNAGADHETPSGGEGLSQ